MLPRTIEKKTTKVKKKKKKKTTKAYGLHGDVTAIKWSLNEQKCGREKGESLIR